MSSGHHAILQPISTAIVLFATAVLSGCNNVAPNANQTQTGGIAAPIAKPAASSLYRGVLIRPEMIDDESLAMWQRDSMQIVLSLDDSLDVDRAAQALAAEKLRDAGFQVEYWIEIARCVRLADAHPEWMCSLQGHDEWRRLFPELPEAAEGEVVKNYPWVPILYEESYAAQLDRVASLVAELPAPKRIWLNDLQGGPSACGCGHPLCRWTADYGPIHTATPLGDDAAANFVRAIQEKFPAAEIVPVWATECEAEDEHDACGGVGCFKGICWQAYVRQLMHLEKIAPRIGVQCFYKALDRDLPRFGSTAGWLRFALQSFQVMPPQRAGQAIAADRLIAVIQGWDVTADERNAQIAMAEQAGAAGYLLATFSIPHDWRPQTFKLSLLQKPE